MKSLLVGVSSSIACYKVIDLIKKLKNKFEIDVILTKNTLNLIDKKDFENALGKEITIELFKKDYNYKKYLKNNKEIKHISLADKTDIFLVCPATANVIGKIANGIADDLLTSSIMATKAIKIICPAMNVNMWNNPIVKENVKKLKNLGYIFIGPCSGKLACGGEGEGRLEEVDKIISEIKNIIKNSTLLKNKKILVTAGATIEEIDPVRVITNKSSGKMGIAIAEEAAKMGADVTLIRGRTETEPEGKIKNIRINSVNELFNEIQKNINKNDILIHSAAVSDFSVEKTNKKIKSNKKLILKLKPSIKIINKIKKLNKSIFLIGFKAEHNISEKELIERAYKKLKEADCDLIVANDVRKDVFGSDYNDIIIIDKNKKLIKVKATKKEIAFNLLKIIINHIENHSLQKI